MFKYALLIFMLVCIWGIDQKLIAIINALKKMGLMP